MIERGLKIEDSQTKSGDKRQRKEREVVVEANRQKVLRKRGLKGSWLKIRVLVEKAQWPAKDAWAAKGRQEVNMVRTGTPA